MLHSLPAVVMEMLVYSKRGEVELLPALSSDISKGSIKGVCCRNGVIVKMMSWDLDATTLSVQLQSRKAQTTSIRFRPSAESLRVEVDGKQVILKARVFQLEMKSGQPVDVEFKWD